MASPLSGRERVLVRLPSWLGDFVMSEPLLRALDERMAPGTLTLAARVEHLALLEGRFPSARRLALEEHGTGALGAWRGHDVALLCSGSFRSAWRALVAGIPRRIGFARDGRGPLLTDGLEPARERGATPLGLGRAGRGQRYLPRPLERSLAELLGRVGISLRDPRPRLEVREPWLAQARARRQALGLAGAEPFLLANVGARERSAKGYPPEHWARALDELQRRSALPLLLVCGPGEEPVLEAVRARLVGARALVDPCAGLTELAAHCSEAQLVLTADSGPRHVARAVAASVVAVLGPTDPRHTAGPRSRERLLRVEVPCGPCHRERCPLPGAEFLRCMTEVQPSSLVSAALELLGRAGAVSMGR